MADRPTQLFVTRLQAVLRPDAFAFDFWVDLNGPMGPSRFMVAPECLLDYGEFQLAVLRRVGAVYRHVLCEGRPVEAANEAWRAFTTLVEYGPQTPPDPPPAASRSESVH